MTRRQVSPRPNKGRFRLVSVALGQCLLPQVKESLAVFVVGSWVVAQRGVSLDLPVCGPFDLICLGGLSECGPWPACGHPLGLSGVALGPPSAGEGKCGSSLVWGRLLDSSVWLQARRTRQVEPELPVSQSHLGHGREFSQALGYDSVEHCNNNMMNFLEELL